MPFPPQLAERLDYQPVRLILYQSGVNRIVLARSDAIVDQVGAITRSYAQPDFFVRLRPNNGVAAVIKNPLSIKITNDIIQREFLYDQVQGIFLSDLGEMEASVVLTNGDTVSGKHNLPNELDFETPWGEESISIDQIESITRDRSIRLVPSGIDNPKFVIVRDNE